MTSILDEDKTWHGLATGILGPLFGFYAYYEMEFSQTMSMRNYVHFIGSPDLLAKVFSLSVLANLPLFFGFLRYNREKAARAVLGTTIIYAIAIAALKIFA